MRLTPTLLALALLGHTALAQNPLAIPPALDQDTFDLVVDEHMHQFFPGVNTNTYGATTGTLDLGHVPGGTYMLLLHGAEGSTRVRVMKE